MKQTSLAQAVIENSARLNATVYTDAAASLAFACSALRNDCVALLRGASVEQADALMFAVAEHFGVSEQLEIQAGFAAFRGHRSLVSQYFMTVNTRDTYQVIPPHSEGTQSVGMQLAAFYCIENSTDGGETILLNVDSDGAAWQTLREVAHRGVLRNRQLTREEAARARTIYGLESVSETLEEGLEILSRVDSSIAGLDVYRVLAKPQPIQCRIQQRPLFAYWDSIASYDFDSGTQYLALLDELGLLKNSTPPQPAEALDNAFARRVWHSGADFNTLFKARLTLKLAPGDVIIQNNISWTHANSNWTPGSGVRNVVAAFA